MNTDNLSPANLVARAKAPTPSFWKKIQKVALIVGGVAATILAAPVAIPAAIVTGAAYAAAVSGGVAAIAQLTKKDTAK